MKALIFGASGQDGFYLTELLRSLSIETIGASRTTGDLIGDIADWDFVARAIRQNRPAYVFHFAAHSTTAHPAVFDNHRAISTGALNVLEAVAEYHPAARVFLSGSAVQFVNEGGAPIDERTAFAAYSAYAVSRIQSVYAARYYRRARGLQAYVGYFFNHDSPRRPARHINQQIARAARGGTPIEIGAPAVKKEFNFAGDAVRAAWILVNQTGVYEAVIGSGTAHSIADWIELCFAAAGRDWREYVTIKKDFTPEYQILVSAPALIKSLGWQPRVTVSDLAKMMVAA